MQDDVPATTPTPAPLKKRLLGFFFDAGLMWGVAMIANTVGWASALLLGLSIDNTGGEMADGSLLAMGLVLVAVLVVFAVQSTLVGTRGQSVGKMVAGTRIVLEDGSPCGWVAGVGLRTVAWEIMVGVLAFMSMCTLAWVLPFANALFLLQPGHRPLHDRLASTIVVEA